MKTAKEMFEELGYKYENAEDGIIRYTSTDDTYCCHSFTFLKYHMVYCDDGWDSYANFNIPLVKAILKQMEELGWDDE